MTRADTGTDAAGYLLHPVQFSRLTKRGIMLGLSLPQLVVLGAAVLLVVASLYLAGGTGLLFTCPAWASCALLAAVPVGGRKLIEWVPVVAAGSRAPTSGSSSTVAGSSNPAPPGPSPYLATPQPCRNGWTPTPGRR